jgi:hypothetical protein
MSNVKIENLLLSIVLTSWLVVAIYFYAQPDPKGLHFFGGLVYLGSGAALNLLLVAISGVKTTSFGYSFALVLNIVNLYYFVAIINSWIFDTAVNNKLFDPVFTFLLAIELLHGYMFYKFFTK